MSYPDDPAPKASPPPPEEAPKPRLEPRPYQDEITMIGMGAPQPAALDWEDDEGQTRIRPPSGETPEELDALDGPPTTHKTLLFGNAVPVPGLPGFGAVATAGHGGDAAAPHGEDLRATTRMDRSPLADPQDLAAPARERRTESPAGFDPRARVTATALARVQPPSAIATPLASTTPIAMPIRPISGPAARSESGRWMAIAAAAVAVCVTAGLFFALPRLGAEPAALAPSPERTSAASVPEVDPEADAPVEETAERPDVETTSPGRLIIESVPRGARVLLVDTARPEEPRLLAGPFPLTLEVPRTGFKLVATRAGHYDFIEPIAFEEGRDEAVMRVELYRRPGSSAGAQGDSAPEEPAPEAPAASGTADEATGDEATADEAPSGSEPKGDAEPADEIDVTKNPYVAPTGDDGETPPEPPAVDSITLQG